MMRRRTTVATRILLSFALLMTAFGLVAGWGVFALRNSAREANLMRDGYLPLARAVRDLVANQDTYNTQLNHIATAKNPTDIRMWFESTLRLGRPRKFAEVRAIITHALLESGDASARRVGQELLDETTSIQRFLAGDAELLAELFNTLDRGNDGRAEALRAELVTRGSQGQKRLSLLEQRVQRNEDALIAQARARESTAIRLLGILIAVTVLVGVAVALYARRVLRPLGAVTERAKVVARGDLTPRPMVASRDEIGELAATFEGMVSAIARANEQLVAAERLATIGKMAAHVTHEIRNPLSSIALNVELLDEELTAGEAEARGLLRAIANEVDRLTELSEQYLSVARQKPASLELEDVADVVREACDFMRPELARHGVRLVVAIAEGLPKVQIDEAQIKQALFNLVRNAREAMPSGGDVTVRAELNDDGGIRISVEDEGDGIDASTRARLFEPFFTTKSHGTGLGLAVTRQIAEAHHGNVLCEARAERGTLVAIDLPPAPEA